MAARVRLQAVKLDVALIPPAMAADNLAMAAYLAVLAVPVTVETGQACTSTLLPSAGSGTAASQQEQQESRTDASQGSEAVERHAESEQQPVASSSSSQDPVTSGSIALSLACASAACALSQPIAAWLNLRPLTLTVMAVITMSLSSLLRLLLTGPQSKSSPPRPSKTQQPSPFAGWCACRACLGKGVSCVPTEGSAAGKSAPACRNSQHKTSSSLPINTLALLVFLLPRLAGSAQMGGALMLVFFAVIGAAAGGLAQGGGGSAAALLTLPAMLGFMTVMVTVHWAVMAAAGSLLGLPRQALLLGSNANIGGPATAASKWHMQPCRPWCSSKKLASHVLCVR